MLLTAASVFGRSIYVTRRLRHKSQSVNTAESLEKLVPSREPDASDEKSAGQLLAAENHDMDVENDVELPRNTMSSCSMTRLSELKAGL